MLVGRKKKAMRDRQLEILAARVPFDVRADVEVIAKREGLTLTQVVRRAIYEYVARHRHPQAAA